MSWQQNKKDLQKEQTNKSLLSEKVRIPDITRNVRKRTVKSLMLDKEDKSVVSTYAEVWVVSVQKGEFYNY